MGMGEAVPIRARCSLFIGKLPVYEDCCWLVRRVFRFIMALSIYDSHQPGIEA